MSNIKLSKVDKYKKFQLASLAGFRVIQVDNRYKIDGADDFIDNDFRSIDDILKLISPELKCKGFNIAA